LGVQLQPLNHDQRLDDLPGKLIAVDDTELPLPRVGAGEAGRLDDRRDDIHESFLDLACCVICWRRLNQGFF